LLALALLLPGPETRLCHNAEFRDSPSACKNNNKDYGKERAGAATRLPRVYPTLRTCAALEVWLQLKSIQRFISIGLFQRMARYVRRCSGSMPQALCLDAKVELFKLSSASRWIFRHAHMCMLASMYDSIDAPLLAHRPICSHLLFRMLHR
jgi:hypothetical protein